MLELTQHALYHFAVEWQDVEADWFGVIVAAVVRLGGNPRKLLTYKS
jgi:hypothetical protein